MQELESVRQNLIQMGEIRMIHDQCVAAVGAECQTFYGKLSQLTSAAGAAPMSNEHAHT